MAINTFIFDLGGVIIDLDEQATIRSFSKAANASIETIQEKTASSSLFPDYEKGLISDQEFRTGINSLFACSLTDKQIDKSWNAMLGAIPAARLDLLLGLKTKYKVMILSNTNAIHIRAFNRILHKTAGKRSLHSFADHVFLSYELHMRKPDVEIYEEVLKRSKTAGSEVLFMDDRMENLLSAAKIGINTRHIETPDQMLELNAYI